MEGLTAEELKLAEQEIGALCKYVGKYRVKCNESLVGIDSSSPLSSGDPPTAKKSLSSCAKSKKKAAAAAAAASASAQPACQRQCESFNKFISPILFVRTKSSSSQKFSRKDKAKENDLGTSDTSGLSMSDVSQSSHASSLDDSREYIENEIDSDDEMEQPLSMSSVSSDSKQTDGDEDLPLYDRLFVREPEKTGTSSKLSAVAQAYRSQVDSDVQRIAAALLNSNSVSGPLMLRNTSQAELDTLPRCPDETDDDADLLVRSATSFPRGYSHDTAKVMVRYTTASYCNTHNSANLECGCESVDRKFRVTQRFYHEQKDAYGFVGVHDEAGYVVSSFRGTVSLRNWISNLQFLLVDANKCDEFTALPMDVRLHLGFYATYHAISPGMIAEVLKQHKENPTFKMYVTGHSLGGAMASLHAMALVLAGIPAHLIEMYTFGQPRAGNEAFAREWDARIQKGYRIVNNYDIVCHLPPHTSGFKHVGEELWFSTKLSAVQLKEYLEKNQRLLQRKIDVIDETGLLDMCANTTPFCRLGIVDHLLYCDRITGERRLRGARPPRNPFKSDGRLEVVSENFLQQAYDPSTNVVIWEYVPMSKCCKNKSTFKLLNEWAKTLQSFKLKIIQINVKENDLPDNMPPIGNMTVYFKAAGNTSADDAKIYRLESSLNFRNLKDLVDSYRT